MAEWTTLGTNQGLLKAKLGAQNTWIPVVLGALLARGDLLGTHPFGIAYGAALLFLGDRGALFALAGVILGSLTLGQPLLGIQTALLLAVAALILPRLRRKKGETLLLAVTTGLLASGMAALFSGVMGLGAIPLLWTLWQFFFVGGAVIVCWFALSNQESVLRGHFTQEQGIAWVLLLIGILSGLQGIPTGQVNIIVVLINFFVLYAAERHGGGTAAGIGCLLGFLSGLNFDMQHLFSAGMYGVVGFCTGAFQRFGRLGMGSAFVSLTLLFTVFFQQEVLVSQLVSTLLGLLCFLVWPRPAANKDYLKPKKIPEVETTITKVKTVAEIFQQIAFSCQAAETEISEGTADAAGLFNVLVERVCTSCVTRETCWEREFYKTYRFLNDLSAIIEENPAIQVNGLPPELKRYCGKPKEMLLGIKFLLDQEGHQQAWRRQLAQNQEALSGQFQNVSQIMGHLAKELHMRHNLDQIQPSNLARRRRSLLNVGTASFCKSGNFVCGDHYISLAFAPSQHAFILSDGMGVGENAGKLSALALKLLEQLMNTGFEPEGAVQALNSILVLRSPEESFVTVDMAILDLESDELKMMKVGASPSYLIAAERVEELAAAGLPVGILNRIEVPVMTREFKAEDTLVLITDGVQDVRQDGTDWLADFLPQVKFNSSQELAEKIVKEARRLSAEQMLDDGVVLVVRKNFWKD
ncbi:MAG: SpoIIE family protein phosphatase [Peptococcaceae bacterium]|nr:SpoIIE family protein phosphatase [Peptococcaceae bacterium]